MTSIATLKALADPIKRWTKIKINHRQSLLTSAELKALPGIGSENKDVIVHFFGGPYDFWATEFNPLEGEFFGLVQIAGNEPELGYVMARDLCGMQYPVSLCGPSGRSVKFRMPIERDLYWTKQTLSEVKK